jgi:NADH-ubiquinone oxidoreductase chain 2
MQFKMLIQNLLLIILSNAVTIRRDKTIIYNRISLLAITAGTIDLFFVITYKAFDKGIGLFNNLFHLTSSAIVFQLFTYILTIIIFQLISFFPRKLHNNNYNVINTIKTNINTTIEFVTNKIGEQFKIMEYSLMLMFIISGANLLVISNDVVTIFIAIELQSYGLYLLCALYKNSEQSTYAGLVYFLLGGLSSCFILLGTSLLYTNTGATNLENFYIINNLYTTFGNYASSNDISLYINYSILIMVIGFLFKISAAPFHFWSPDVYDSIPTITTTFVTVIAKISIFAFFLELVHYTDRLSNPFDWIIILTFSSLLSFIVGAVLGLNQSRIKRLLAYSTISHVGFILLAISINSTESVQSFAFYITQYSLSNLNVFMLIITIGYTLYRMVPKHDIFNKEEYKELEKQDPYYSEKVREIRSILELKEKNYSPLQIISQLKGYFFFNPVLSVSLAVTIYSFVGVPPLIGFFGKQMVLSSALDNGLVFLCYIAIATSVISAVYYLGIIKQMFFDSSNFKSIDLKSRLFNNELANNVTVNSSLTLFTSMITLIIMSFFYVPQEWLSLTNVLSLLLFNI